MRIICGQIEIFNKEIEIIKKNNRNLESKAQQVTELKKTDQPGSRAVLN